MMAKPTVLTFVRHYLPGDKSGGPVRTIANMVELLSDDFNFCIVTSDRDALETEPYPNIFIDAWNLVGKANVFYASPSGRSVKRIACLMRETNHDLVYLNSFFHPVFTLRPLLAQARGYVPKRPTVLAPRGEFANGALALKAWKKRFFIRLSRVIGSYQHVTWQASSEREAHDIKRILGHTARRIVVAPDLALPVRDEPLDGDARSAGEPLRVVFLSRIAPIKNLDFALRVLGQVALPVEMGIYGPVDDDVYWRYCRDLIDSLPVHISVRYCGFISHARVAATLSKHHLFFLPTRGENYGHAIYEALAVGLPVLISDQTPWTNLQAHGVGWDLSLAEPQSFVEAIETQALLSSEGHRVQRLRAKKYAAQVSSDLEVVARNRSLFWNLLKASGLGAERH